MILMITFCFGIHHKIVNAKRNLYYATGRGIPQCLYSLVHNCIVEEEVHQIADFLKNMLKFIKLL